MIKLGFTGRYEFEEDYILKNIGEFSSCGHASHFLKVIFIILTRFYFKGVSYLNTY